MRWCKYKVSQYLLSSYGSLKWNMSFHKMSSNILKFWYIYVFSILLFGLFVNKHNAESYDSYCILDGWRFISNQESLMYWHQYSLLMGQLYIMCIDHLCGHLCHFSSPNGLVNQADLTRTNRGRKFLKVMWRKQRWNRVSSNESSFHTWTI